MTREDQLKADAQEIRAALSVAHIAFCRLYCKEPSEDGRYWSAVAALGRIMADKRA